MKLADVKVGQRVKFNTNEPYNSWGTLTDDPATWVHISVGTTAYGELVDSDGDVRINYVDVDGFEDWALVNLECLELVKEVE